MVNSLEAKSSNDLSIVNYLVQFLQLTVNPLRNQDHPHFYGNCVTIPIRWSASEHLTDPIYNVCREMLI